MTAQQYKHLKEMKRALESGASVPSIVGKVLPENLFYNIYGGLTPEAQFREPLIILARPGKYGMSVTKDCCVITIPIQRVGEKPPVRFSPSAPPPASSKIAMKQKKKVEEKRGEILNTVLKGHITNYITGGTSLQSQKKIPLFVVARPGAYTIEVEKAEKGYRIYLPIEKETESEQQVYNQGQNWVFRKSASLTSTQGTSSSASLYASAPSILSGMKALSVSSDIRLDSSSGISKDSTGLQRHESNSTLTEMSGNIPVSYPERSSSIASSSSSSNVHSYSTTSLAQYFHPALSSRVSTPLPAYPYLTSSPLAYPIPSLSSMPPSPYQSSSAATYPSTGSRTQRYNPQKLQIPRPKSFAHYADTFGY